jgi:ArsR family transcriptional regulator
MSPESKSRRAAAARGPQGPIYEAKAELFRAVGHPVRVRIIELLRDGERSVGALQGALGLDSSGTSQHLAALRRQGLVVGRRDGTSVYYSVRDPLVFDLLEVVRRILSSELVETTALLSDLAEVDHPPDAAHAGTPHPNQPRT